MEASPGTALVAEPLEPNDELIGAGEDLTFSEDLDTLDDERDLAIDLDDNEEI